MHGAIPHQESIADKFYIARTIAGTGTWNPPSNVPISDSFWQLDREDDEMTTARLLIADSSIDEVGVLSGAGR